MRQKDKRAMTRRKLKTKMEHAWAACKGFLAKRWRWVLFGLVLIFIVLIYLGYGAHWTGFVAFSDSTGARQREKTL